VKREDLAKLKIRRIPVADSEAVAGATRRPLGRYALLAVLLIGAYLLYSGLDKREVEVDIGTVNTIFPSQAYTLLSASGYVVPQTKADVASKATGRLEKLEVEEGSVVKTGQILARIENRDITANLNQAAANVLVAKTNLQKAEAELRESSLALNRVRTLAARKFVSPEAVDTEIARHAKAVASVDSAKAEIAAAEAAYEGAQVALEYTLIRAPFDGVVLSKHADIGDILAPFSSTSQSKGSVVSMADLNTLKVEADVSESSLSKVRLGQPCEIQLDALPDRRYRGVVDQIVPTVDRTKATVMVKVGFIDKDSRILPDMSAKVAFLSREVPAGRAQPVTAVLASALVKRNGGDAAFRVEDRRARKVPVETGDRLGDFVVIRNGLKPGDQVVLQPPSGLEDGSPLRLPKP
jgi:RND family efflux transporter MFP subunit